MELERTVNAGGLKSNAWTVLGKFIVFRSFFGFDELRVEDLLWACEGVTKHSVNFVPTGTTYAAHLVCYGGHATIAGTDKAVDDILRNAAESAPWALFGFSKDLAAKIKVQPGDLSATVEAKKELAAQPAARATRARPPGRASPPIRPGSPTSRLRPRAREQRSFRIDGRYNRRRMSEPVPSILSVGGPGASAEGEAGYLAARELLLRPPVFQQKTLLLVGTLALFLMTSLRRDGSAFGRSLTSLAIIVGVLFVHETGHFLGMRAFGYRDVRMFFIPFFGAAVAGKSRGIERWKQGVVLLLGPLPGIVVGCALLAFARSTPLVSSIARALVFVNAFNLLPVAPFDGGQLFQLVLFSRQRVLETAFLVFAGFVLFALGILGQSWIFGFLGVSVLAGTPFQSRARSAAMKFRTQHPTLTPDAESLGDSEARALYGLARDTVAAKSRETAKSVAFAMDMILERATQAAPSLRVSAALLLAWTLGIGLSFVSVQSAARWRLPPANWKTYTYSQAGFSVDCPTPPVLGTDGAKDGRVICVHGTRIFLVSWETAPATDADTADLLMKGRDKLIARAGGTLELQEPPRPGEAGNLRFSFRSTKMRHAWARLELDETRQFTLLSSSQDEASDAQRFLDSFHLLH